jgi:acyl carrier protein
VLAGSDDCIARVQARLEAAGIACRALHTSHAFHSAMMDPVVEPFLAFVRTVTLHPPRIPIVSTVTAQPLRDADATDPAYWARHLRATVQFSGALQRAIADGGNLFIEVGPRSTLANLAVQHFAKAGAPCAAVALLGEAPEPESEILGLATALGRIWASGLELPWQRIWPAAQRVPVIAPYPFERLDFRFSEGREASRRAAPAPAVAHAAAPAAALAAPAARAAVPEGAPAEAPQALAAALATLFSDFGGVAIERADTSFIEAGFDSLVLMQIGVELGKKFGVSVSLGDLMRKHNTLSRLAAHIAQAAAPERLPGRAATPVPVAAPAPSTPTPAPAQTVPAAAAVLHAHADPADVGALGTELAALFADFAGVAIDQPQATFIESGFDSLVLMQIGVELGKKYGVSVSLADLMRKHNTLGRLARHLSASAAPQRLPPVAPAVPAALAGAAPAAAAAVPPPAGLALAPAAGWQTMDASQLFELQMRQMKEIFDWQLRHLAHGAAAQAQAPVTALPPGLTAAVPPTLAGAGAPEPAAGAGAVGVVRRADGAVAPLTITQERVRFTEEMFPGRNVFSISTAYRLSGEMSPSLFAQALRQVIRRQAVLRSFVARGADGKWVQRTLEDLDYRLPFEDLSELPDLQRDAELRLQMQAIVDQPFDLHVAPLFRAALWKLGAQEHVFLFVPHHLVWDGWSFDLLSDELAAIYDGLVHGSVPELPPLDIDYGDYAQWHGAWLAGAQCAAQLAYWKALFEHVPAPRPILTDHPRNAGRSGQGSLEWLQIDTERSERLRAIARSAGGSLSMLMTAAYAALIQQMVGGDHHVVLGIAVRGRSRPELDPVMGFFSNMLPLPLQADPGQPFADWVGVVGERLAEALNHQDVPFEMLATEPRIAAWGRHAGVPVHALMSFQDARRRRRNWGGLASEHLVLAQHTATDDFGLWVTDRPEGIEGRLVINADVFGRGTGPIVRRRLETFIARILARPRITLAELMALDEAESQQLAAWSESRDGVRILDARGALAPIGVPGEAWRQGAATGERARWTFDGALQMLDAATAQPSAAPRRPVPAVTALSTTEQILARVWCAVLDLPAVRAEDNFFELGGTSLEAMQVAMQLEKILGRTVNAHQFVMGSLRSIAGGYEGTEPAPAADGAAAAPPQSDAARAAASGAARRLRVSQEKSGVVARVAGLFRRNGAVTHPAPPAPDASAPGAAARAREPAPATIGLVVPAGNSGGGGPADAPSETLLDSADALVAWGPSGLQRVRHAQPPVPGAFRAPAGANSQAWYRRDETTGRYELLGP